MSYEPADDVVAVILDQEAAEIVIHVPEREPLRLPMGLFRFRVRIGDDGLADLRLRLKADELHLAAPPADEVTITVPDAVTPEQAFNAQMAAIQRKAGHGG